VTARLRRRGVTAVSGSGNFADDVWDALLSPSATVYVTRVSVDQYKMQAQIGRGSWVTWTIGTVAGLPGSKTPIPHQFNTIITEYPVLSKDDLDASFAYTGAGWSILSGNHRTSTTGDYVDWTTPDNTTCVGWVPVRASNCGYALVSIDGSTTAANLLTTAQQEVDAGRLASTALVANGGTLNPTDRLFNCHSGSSALNRTMIADGLAPAVHTVRFTCTGYKQGTSTDVRINVTSAYYGGGLITNPTTASVVWVLGRNIRQDSGSAFEYAYTMRSGGVEHWIGNIHGYEAESAFSVEVDGTPQTMTDGQILSGTEIQFHSTRNMYHSNVGAGATIVGTAVVAYTFTQNGLHIEHTTTWATTLSPRTAYPAMFPVSEHDADVRYETFWRGSGSDIAADVALASGDDSRDSMAHSGTVWLWSPGGQMVAAVRHDDVETALQNFTYSETDDVFIQDRASAAPRINKVYFTLNSDVDPDNMPDVVNGTEWWSGAAYRLAIVADADALCSRGL
jgi:hypothetical protein